jgi:hypothetical protein
MFKDLKNLRAGKNRIVFNLKEINDEVFVINEQIN